MTRRRARAGRLAAVDGACDHAARQRDLAARGASRARGDVAAVDGTCDRTARDIDFAFCERAASRRMGAVKRAAQVAVRNFGFVFSCVFRVRRLGKIYAVSVVDSAARDFDAVFLGFASGCHDFCAVGVGDRAARDFELVFLGIARISERAVGLVFLVLDKSAVSGDVERAARNSEFVAFNGLPARRASRPCFIVRGRLAVRRRMIAEPEAVDKDVLRGIARMVVCVETVFEIADDLLLRAIGGVVAETDARRIVHRCEEPRIVGARREAEAAGIDFDARPVQAGRCAAAYGEQGVSNGRRAVEVELGLAEVLNAAHRDVLCVDIERVVRHDVACRAARCAAIEEGIVQGGRRQRSVALAEVDGVARRLACAVRPAAVDFSVRTEGSFFNVDGVA